MPIKKSEKKKFNKYFSEVRDRYLTSDYTEGTYRTPFENFINSFSPSINLVQEPKRKQDLGAPDFKAFYQSTKVGYIETKDVDKNLDNTLESEQLKKYSKNINNLILTNYGRYILLRNGEKIYDFHLFRFTDLEDKNFVFSDEKIEQFIEFINVFFSYKLPTITSAKEMAKELAKKVKILKEMARIQLREDLRQEKNEGTPSSIYDFYKGIKELIQDIGIEDCADAYAQTVAYGLFLAKKNLAKKYKRVERKVSRENAALQIPSNIGVIKRIFINISGDSFPPNVSWVVDDIIDVLNASKINQILTKINKRGKKDKDPIIFFYEDFLDFYEPEKRKHLGVYYTPRPIVNFIVNSIHIILKREFDKNKGFAEDDVEVLDPAIGTGTFFWIAFLRTIRELTDAGLRGILREKIKNHILKHFYGFEILITPYVISHLKLTDLIERWNYKLQKDDRIQVYLTNTLEPGEVHGLLPFLRELTEETRMANKIKSKKSILVVLGNPPYSVSSSNKSKWILNKMGDYKEDLDEKNIQPLDDDYIKFIRFAQWKIEQNGQGIVGFITNNSYLDGVIHRRMRESLLKSFDKVYLLNLHGSAKREPDIPEGKKDGNVFDIQQGVSISIFIKNNKLENKGVFYADLFGTKNEKFKWLDSNLVNAVKWQQIKPTEPYYFFVPKDFSLQEEYDNFWKVTEIFEDRVCGVGTYRDYLVIDSEKDELLHKIKLMKGEKSNEEVKQKLNIRNTKRWKFEEVRTKIKNKELQEKILPYSYRPFDKRWIIYEKELVARDRYTLMKHMIGKQNIALVTSRLLSKPHFYHIFVSQYIGDVTYITSRTKERSYFFPLYLYTDKEDKQPNFTDEFYDFIQNKYNSNKKISPEAIFRYIYAVLHSDAYRTKFIEFLKIDFPCIPFVDNYNTFKELSKMGKELIDLHLMRTKLSPNVEFNVEGSMIVNSIKYENNKIFINKDQYFGSVPEEIWEFNIGSYQVLYKWLKDRKNQKLEGSDIEQFLQTIEIIKKTIQIMEKIDNTKFLEKS